MAIFWQSSIKPIELAQKLTMVFFNSLQSKGLTMHQNCFEVEIYWVSSNSLWNSTTVVILATINNKLRRKVFVLLGPPVVEDGYNEKYVAEEKDVVKLNCPISGNPKPIIEWYQDDQLIHPMRDRFRTSRKSLKIKGVNLADSGIFECKGVNGFGSLSVQVCFEQNTIHTYKKDKV